ncbi:hypothetical protein [Nocardioides pantholopis]|uniref:hypothetical protein n=1 Tax=Nocardioides pantholopis TaxID=2483798 RepID=UPI000F08776C|nr:hypothetical protein [Nocardioides pantholopis]
MTTLTRRRTAFRGSLAATTAALALVFAGSPAAHAATIDVDYDVTGSTTIASTGSTIALGPAVLATRVEADGAFAADLDLPGTRTQFKLAGFIPVTANVAFEAVGETAGQLSRVGRTQVATSTSSYYVRLSNIKAAGLPLFAGPFCRTREPVVIQADTPAGEAFDIVKGGRLVGEYSIGKFQHCGLNTLLINSIIPGDGNTIELNVSNGRLTPTP